MNINKHEALKKIYDISGSVEELGASEELTDITEKLSELGRSVNALLDERDELKRKLSLESSRPIYRYLKELSATIFEGMVKRGFWEEERNVGELLMLVTSELAEALEADRDDYRADKEAYVDILNAQRSDELVKEAFEEYIKDSFEDEIADAIIRLLDISAGLNIDIGFHIREKLRYNETRAYKHGKKY